MGIFLIYVLNSLGLNLFRRIFCIFYGSSHWSFSVSSQDARDLWAAAACARTVTCSRGPQRTRFSTDRAGGVPLQQVPEAGGHRGPAARRDAGERLVSEQTHEAGHAHTPGHLTPRTSLHWFLSGFAAMFAPPAGCWAEKRTGNFHVQIGSNQSVMQAGGTGLNSKIQVTPSRSCKRTNKIILIAHKDETDCLFMLNFYSWIFIFGRGTWFF